MRNFAKEGYVSQSGVTNNGYASKAVDGNKNMKFSAGSCTQTGSLYEPWWRIDFFELVTVHKITITNRDDCIGKSVIYIFAVVLFPDISLIESHTYNCNSTVFRCNV